MHILLGTMASSRHLVPFPYLRGQLRHLSDMRREQKVNKRYRHLLVRLLTCRSSSSVHKFSESVKSLGYFS